jgi:hypothetical protein
MNIGSLSALKFLAATTTAVGKDATLKSVTAPDGFFGSFKIMLQSILNIVLTIGVIAVLLYLIWGGIEWITSGGDKGKTESARNKITSAVIGLVILISAWAILQFVQSLLGLKILT